MRLSYSSCKQLQTCSKQFYLQRIAKVDKDPDVADEQLAFLYGKCYHETLELTRHSRANFTMAIFDSVFNKYFPVVTTNGFTDVASDNLETRFGVYACLQSYYTLHEKRNLELVATEIEIGDENTIGFVDAVVADSFGHWWVMDLKTSGLVQEPLFARLHTDPQLNLYASYASQLCNKCDIDLAKFAGCRYCVVVKPRLVIKKNESMEDYAKRVSPKIYDVEIPWEILITKKTVDHYVQMQELVKNLNEDTATCNYDACLVYNRPCNYWSHCHGNTYTDCVKNAVAFTGESIIDRTIVPDAPDFL